MCAESSSGWAGLLTRVAAEPEDGGDSGDITISAVLPNSLSAELGLLKPGMVLKRIGGTEVRIPPMAFEVRREAGRQQSGRRRHRRRRRIFSRVPSWSAGAGAPFPAPSMPVAAFSDVF